MKNSNTAKLFLIAILTLFGFFSITLFAQDEKDEMNSKLDQLKGKVEKVTVKVDGKDVVFEGKDAERLSKSLRLFSKTPRMMWLSDDDEDFNFEGGNVLAYKFEDDDFDWKERDGDKKKVEVKIEDGEKKVTVTTEKDGKEETKVYEGEEAEKFLKENKKEKGFKVFIGEGDDTNGDVISFNKRIHEDGCCCDKRMHMKMPMHGKGIKKIIIEKEGKSDKAKEEKSEKK